MTLEDLMFDVEVLGGDNGLSNATLFTFATNRALRRLYSDRNILKTVRLAVRRPRPIAYYKEINCINGETGEYPIEGTAYSMRIHGNCKYMITDGETSTIYTVDSKNEAIKIKGFLTYGGSISFWSSFAFTVYDLAIYDSIYSEFTSDIPDLDARRVLDIRELYGDFMSFTSPPTDKYGNPIKNVKMYDGRLEIDSDFVGEILLTYRRMPTEIPPGTGNPTIDITEEYSYILSLLVAYYYYYNIAPELANGYLSCYEDIIARMNSTSYQQLDPAYVDTNGWA